MIMDKCMAAVFTGAGRPLEIQEFPILPIERGGALVQMQMAAICGTDVHASHLDTTPAPTIFGHENIGILAEISPEIKTDVLGQDLKIGDRVIFRDAPCGRCFQCSMGESCQHSKSYGMLKSTEAPHLRGGFGQYLQLAATPWLLRVPDDLSNERALLSVIGNHTCLNGIERIGGINSADTVVVQGSGPIGLGALNQSLIGGAANVIVIGAPESRLELSTRLCATQTVSLSEYPTPESRVERIKELTQGRGADLVIEASGGLTAFQEGLEMVRFGGRYLVIGQWTDYGLLSANPALLTRKVIRVQGVFSAGPRHIIRSMQSMRSIVNRPVEELITHRYELKGVNEGFEAHEKLEAMVAVILPNGEPAN
tara:strand:- start:1372 stop:2475 length:1104 start_codon:yes stop_codon:yes gene_type:complete